MEYKVAIIGPKNVVSGFKALGVTVFDAADAESALAILKQIKKGIDEPTEGVPRYAAVLVMEHILEKIPPEELDRISRGALPAIVALPGLEGSHGAGTAKLKRLAERAIGSDILG